MAAHYEHYSSRHSTESLNLQEQYRQARESVEASRHCLGKVWQDILRSSVDVTTSSDLSATRRAYMEDVEGLFRIYTSMLDAPEAEKEPEIFEEFLKETFRRTEMENQILNQPSVKRLAGLLSVRSLIGKQEGDASATRRPIDYDTNNIKARWNTHRPLIMPRNGLSREEADEQLILKGLGITRNLLGTEEGILQWEQQKR